jgi:hypothetical protein
MYIAAWLHLGLRVNPVTWLLMIGGTASVAPGISDAGIPAYEASDETAALLTDGI